MKTIIAASLAVLLLVAALSLSQTTVSERMSQSCSSSSSYQNSWRDVYFITEWWPNRDEGKAFVDCVGPAEYIRYHPYDIALLSLLGATVAGAVAYRAETTRKKKT